MLAEIFMLLLEQMIRTRTYADGAPKVVSKSPHVPIAEAPSLAPVSSPGETDRK